MDVSFLANLTALTQLNLSHNRIKDLSYLRPVFKSLTELDLSNNFINETSLQFLNASRFISTLLLSNNRLESADFIKNFDHLEVLDLSNNQIKSIDSFPVSKKLIELYLDHNELTSVDVLADSDLTSLEKLKISFNHINVSTGAKRTLNMLTSVRQVHLDRSAIELFRFENNHRKKLRNKIYKFLQSIFLIVDSDEFLGCDLILGYLRLNIHLNLFFNDQLDLFLDECHYHILEI